MKKVMVYEPDQDLLDIICLALEMEGFDAFGLCVCDAGFLALVDSIQPDLLLLDFSQTGEFGRKWCGAIKCIYPDLPILALSCHNNISKICGEAGFDACLSKPFDLEELYAIVWKFA